MKEIIGRKIGMTSVFATDGTMYPVTVIEVLPNVVTQKKTVENDGYEALQIGYEDKKEQREEFRNRMMLVSAARKGDSEAIETLTLKDMDTYQFTIMKLVKASQLMSLKLAKSSM